MKTVPVSVVIPTYKRPYLTFRTVRSIFENQDILPEEVIVIEDDSKPISYPALRSFIDKKLIKYLVNERNRGVSYSRNRGVKESRCDFICFLDSDDFFLKDKIKIHYEFMKRNPRIMGSLSNGIILNNYKRKLPRYITYLKEVKRDYFVLSDIDGSYLIFPSGAMFRKEVFNVIKWDERLKASEEIKFFLDFLFKFRELHLIDNSRELIVFDRRFLNKDNLTIRYKMDFWKLKAFELFILENRLYAKSLMDRYIELRQKLIKIFKD